MGEVYSQARPRFKVRLFRTRKSSWTKMPMRFWSMVKGAVTPPRPFWATWSRRKSEKANPVKAPV